MMNERTLQSALIALLIGASAVLAPADAAAQQTNTDEPAAADVEIKHRAAEGVTVRVDNQSWLNMRIYLVEVGTHRVRWRLGDVTGLSTRRFEIPDHLGAEFGDVTLQAEPIGSRERVRTDRLMTYPGARVNWQLTAALHQSFASVL